MRLNIGILNFGQRIRPVVSKPAAQQATAFLMVMVRAEKMLLAVSLFFAPHAHVSHMQAAPGQTRPEKMDDTEAVSKVQATSLVVAHVLQ